MSYTPSVNADTLTLYLGVCATGRATASSTTLDMVSFGTVYNPLPGITFEPSDEGMPIAIVGGGPVDALMPPVYFVQGALFHTTIAAYVSPTEVTLAAAPDTSIFNTGFATVILYRPCPMASDVADVPTAFQFNSSIAPGTADTLQFSVLNSNLAGPLGADNPYVDRFGALKNGQPVYLYSSVTGDVFGGYIDTLTTSSYPGVPGTPYCWSATCASWQGLAKRRVVPPANPQTFTAIDADVVFRTTVLDYLSDDGVAVTTPSGLPTITLAAAVGANIGQLLDQVVSLITTADTAYYWTTDAWRTFILATRAATSAPWNVSDGSDLFAGDTPYQQSIVVSHNQLANQVYFIGQETLLNALNATFIGDGTTTVFNTPLDVGAAPTITLNSTAQTVGILGVDSGKDWYWSQGSTAITQDAAGPILTNTDTLVVSYLTATPGVAQAPVAGSLQQLQAIEGTSAEYDYSTSLTSPILPDDLLALAQGYAAEYGEPATTCQFYTLRPGLATGQLQTIALPDAGIPSGTFLIATIQMTTVNNVIVWQYTAFGGANIGNAITALTQFINRGQGTLNIVTPVTPITGAATPGNANNTVMTYGPGSNMLAFPGNVTQGDLLVCVLQQQAFLANPPILSDTMGNTWALAKFQSATGIVPIEVAILWTIAIGGGPNTVTFTNAIGGTTITMGLAEFSGVAPTSPVDTTGGAIGATPPTITTTQDADIIVTVVGGLTGTAGVTSPEVLLDSTPPADGGGTAFSFEVQSSAGSFASSIVPASASDPAAWATVAFKRAPATSPPSQTITVQGNPTGTVTNSLGNLTSGEPVIGHGGADVTVGSKTGATTEFATSSGAGANGTPALWQTSGDLGAGTTGQLVPPGGGTGQVLTKNSAANGDTKWAPGGGGGSGNITTLGTYAGASSWVPSNAGDAYICTDCGYSFVFDGSANDAFFRGSPTTVLPAVITPLTVSALDVWLSADMITGLSSGATVNEWPNLADPANARGVAAQYTSPATYQTGVVNSLPVVRLGGAAWFRGRVNIPGEMTLFMVISPTALSNAYSGLLGFDWAADQGGYFLKSNGKTALYVAAGLYDGTGSATLSTGAFVVLSMVVGPVAYATQAALSADASGAFTNTPFTWDGNYLLGAQAAGSRILDADIAEVLMYSRGLSSAEISTVSNYLKTKYGL